jgi:cytochrome c biogenesis protein CcmG/thiol:disulfide interchange protein DsbE
MDRPSYSGILLLSVCLKHAPIPEYPDILAIMTTLFGKFVVTIFLAAASFAQAPASAPTPDSAPPKMDLLDLKGGHHTLDEYKGKVVIVNFWATYCVPCATEMPMLSQMQKRYKNQLVVLAVSVDDELDRAKLQPFLHKHQADDLTLLVGPTITDLSDWKMGDALPTTLFIDHDGKLAGKVAGALKRPDLEKRLSALTGTPAAKAASHQKTKTNKDLKTN